MHGLISAARNYHIGGSAWAGYQTIKYLAVYGQLPDVLDIAENYTQMGRKAGAITFAQSAFGALSGKVALLERYDHLSDTGKLLARAGVGSGLGAARALAYGISPASVDFWAQTLGGGLTFVSANTLLNKLGGKFDVINKYSLAIGGSGALAASVPAALNHLILGGEKNYSLSRFAQDFVGGYVLTTAALAVVKYPTQLNSKYSPEALREINTSAKNSLFKSIAGGKIPEFKLSLSALSGWARALEPAIVWGLGDTAIDMLNQGKVLGRDIAGGRGMISDINAQSLHNLNNIVAAVSVARRLQYREHGQEPKRTQKQINSDMAQEVIDSGRKLLSNRLGWAGTAMWVAGPSLYEFVTDRDFFDLFGEHKAAAKDIWRAGSIAALSYKLLWPSVKDPAYLQQQWTTAKGENRLAAPWEIARDMGAQFGHLAPSLAVSMPAITYIQGLAWEYAASLDSGTPTGILGKSAYLATKLFNDVIDFPGMFDVQKLPTSVYRQVQKAWNLTDQDVDNFVEDKKNFKDNQAILDSINKVRDGAYAHKLRNIKEIITSSLLDEAGIEGGGIVRKAVMLGVDPTRGSLREVQKDIRIEELGRLLETAKGLQRTSILTQIHDLENVSDFGYMLNEMSIASWEGVKSSVYFGPLMHFAGPLLHRGMSSIPGLGSFQSWFQIARDDQFIPVERIMAKTNVKALTWLGEKAAGIQRFAVEEFGREQITHIPVRFVANKLGYTPRRSDYGTAQDYYKALSTYQGVMEIFEEAYDPLPNFSPNNVSVYTGKSVPVQYLDSWAKSGQNLYTAMQGAVNSQTPAFFNPATGNMEAANQAEFTGYLQAMANHGLWDIGQQALTLKGKAEINIALAHPVTEKGSPIVYANNLQTLNNAGIAVEGQEKAAAAGTSGGYGNADMAAKDNSAFVQVQQAVKNNIAQLNQLKTNAAQSADNLKELGIQNAKNPQDVIPEIDRQIGELQNFSQGLTPEKAAANFLDMALKTPQFFSTEIQEAARMKADLFRGANWNQSEEFLKNELGFNNKGIEFVKQSVEKGREKFFLASPEISQTKKEGLLGLFSGNKKVNQDILTDTGAKALFGKVQEVRFSQRAYSKEQALDYLSRLKQTAQARGRTDEWTKYAQVEKDVTALTGAVPFKELQTAMAPVYKNVAEQYIHSIAEQKAQKALSGQGYNKDVPLEVIIAEPRSIKGGFSIEPKIETINSETGKQEKLTGWEVTVDPAVNFIYTTNKQGDLKIHPNLYSYLGMNTAQYMRTTETMQSYQQGIDKAKEKGTQAADKIMLSARTYGLTEVFDSITRHSLLTKLDGVTYSEKPLAGDFFKMSGYLLGKDIKDVNSFVQEAGQLIKDNQLAQTLDGVYQARMQQAPVAETPKVAEPGVAQAQSPRIKQSFTQRLEQSIASLARNAKDLIHNERGSWDWFRRNSSKQEQEVPPVLTGTPAQTTDIPDEYRKLEEIALNSQDKTEVYQALQDLQYYGRQDDKAIAALSELSQQVKEDNKLANIAYQLYYLASMENVKARTALEEIPALVTSSEIRQSIQEKYLNENNLQVAQPNMPAIEAAQPSARTKETALNPPEVREVQQPLGQYEQQRAMLSEKTTQLFMQDARAGINYVASLREQAARETGDEPRESSITLMLPYALRNLSTEIEKNSAVQQELLRLVREVEINSKDGQDTAACLASLETLPAPLLDGLAVKLENTDEQNILPIMKILVAHDATPLVKEKLEQTVRSMGSDVLKDLQETLLHLTPRDFAGLSAKINSNVQYDEKLWEIANSNLTFGPKIAKTTGKKEGSDYVKDIMDIKCTLAHELGHNVIDLYMVKAGRPVLAEGVLTEFFAFLTEITYGGTGCFKELPSASRWWEHYLALQQLRTIDTVLKEQGLTADWKGMWQAALEAIVQNRAGLNNGEAMRSTVQAMLHQSGYTTDLTAKQLLPKEKECIYIPIQKANQEDIALSQMPSPQETTQNTQAQNNPSIVDTTKITQAKASSGKLYSFPGMLFDVEQYKRFGRSIVSLARTAEEFIRNERGSVGEVKRSNPGQEHAPPAGKLDPLTPAQQAQKAQEVENAKGTIQKAFKSESVISGEREALVKAGIETRIRINADNLNGITPVYITMALPGTGKSSMVPLVLAQHDKLLIWESSEYLASQTYSLVKGALSNLGQADDIALINLQNPQSLQQDYKNKKVIVVTDENLKFLAGNNTGNPEAGINAGVFSQIVKGRVLMNTDWKDLPALLMSQQEEEKASQDLVSLLQDMDKWLKEKHPVITFLNKIANPEQSYIARLKSVKVEGTNNEVEVRVPYISDKLLKKFFQEQMIDLSKPSQEDNQKRAALLALAKAYTDVSGKDYYITHEGEVRPLSAYGEAHRVFTSNVYEAIAWALVLPNQAKRSGLNGVKIDMDNIHTQKRGRRVITESMLKMAEEYGLKGTILLAGALTEPQTRLLEALYGARIIQEQSQGEAKRIRPTLKDITVRATTQSQEAEIDNFFTQAGRKQSKLVVVDVAKGENSSWDKARADLLKHKDYTRIIVEPDGNFFEIPEEKIFEERQLLSEETRKDRVVELLNNATVTKYQVEEAGLNWGNVSEKLIKNGWAEQISSTIVRLTANPEE
ncbi:MAG: hypothetical protein V1662_05160, partial [Candidatus Omnitrophota bacterium]